MLELSVIHKSGSTKYGDVTKIQTNDKQLNYKNHLSPVAHNITSP